MKRILAACFMAAAIASAEDAVPVPMYRVIHFKDPSAAESPMNEAAALGYRLCLFSGSLAVMRREATPPDTYRYLLVEGDVDPGMVKHLVEGDVDWRPKRLVNSLNSAGAMGYRLDPRQSLLTRELTFVLEKEPHPRNFQYVLAGAVTMNTAWKRVWRYEDEGYGLVYLANNKGKPLAIMERELSGPQRAVAPPPLPASRRFIVVDASRRETFAEKLNATCRDGYRVLDGPFGSLSGGGQSALVEVSEQSYEYALPGKDASAWVQEIGGKGFHLRWDASTQGIFEREIGSPARFEHRLVPASGGLETEANRVSGEGFAPVGFVYGQLVLERRVTGPGPVEGSARRP